MFVLDERWEMANLWGMTTHPLTLFRRDRKLTLTELAARAGISKGYLSEIEAGGSFSIDTGEALVMATGGQVTLDALAKARRKDTAA